MFHICYAMHATVRTIYNLQWEWRTPKSSSVDREPMQNNNSEHCLTKSTDLYGLELKKERGRRQQNIAFNEELAKNLISSVDGPHLDWLNKSPPRKPRHNTINISNKGTKVPVIRKGNEEEVLSDLVSTLDRIEYALQTVTTASPTQRPASYATSSKETKQTVQTVASPQRKSVPPKPVSLYSPKTNSCKTLQPSIPLATPKLTGSSTLIRQDISIKKTCSTGIPKFPSSLHNNRTRNISIANSKGVKRSDSFEISKETGGNVDVKKEISEKVTTNQITQQGEASVEKEGKITLEWNIPEIAVSVKHIEENVAKEPKEGSLLWEWTVPEEISLSPEREIDNEDVQGENFAPCIMEIKNALEEDIPKEIAESELFRLFPHEELCANEEIPIELAKLELFRLFPQEELCANEEIPIELTKLELFRLFPKEELCANEEIPIELTKLELFRLFPQEELCATEEEMQVEATETIVELDWIGLEPHLCRLIPQEEFCVKQSQLPLFGSENGIVVWSLQIQLCGADVLDTPHLPDELLLTTMVVEMNVCPSITENEVDLFADVDIQEEVFVEADELSDVDFEGTPRSLTPQSHHSSFDFQEVEVVGGIPSRGPKCEQLANYGKVPSPAVRRVERMTLEEQYITHKETYLPLDIDSIRMIASQEHHINEEAKHQVDQEVQPIVARHLHEQLVKFDVLRKTGSALYVETMAPLEQYTNINQLPPQELDPPPHLFSPQQQQCASFDIVLDSRAETDVIVIEKTPQEQKACVDVLEHTGDEMYEILPPNEQHADSYNMPLPDDRRYLEPLAPLSHQPHYASIDSLASIFEYDLEQFLQTSPPEQQLACFGNAITALQTLPPQSEIQIYPRPGGQELSEEELKRQKSIFESLFLDHGRINKENIRKELKQRSNAEKADLLYATDVDHYTLLDKAVLYDSADLMLTILKEVYGKKKLKNSMDSGLFQNTIHLASFLGCVELVDLMKQYNSNVHLLKGSVRIASVMGPFGHKIEPYVACHNSIGTVRQRSHWVTAHRDEYPIYYAVCSDQVDIVKDFLADGDPALCDPEYIAHLFCVACTCAAYKCVKHLSVLLPDGLATRDKRGCLMVARGFSHGMPMFQLLTEYGFGPALLNNIDGRNTNALHVYYHNLSKNDKLYTKFNFVFEVTEFCIKQGIDINQESMEFQTHGRKDTPLHLLIDQLNFVVGSNSHDYIPSTIRTKLQRNFDRGVIKAFKLMLLSGMDLERHGKTVLDRLFANPKAWKKWAMRHQVPELHVCEYGLRNVLMIAALLLRQGLPLRYHRREVTPLLWFLNSMGICKDSLVLFDEIAPAESGDILVESMRLLLEYGVDPNIYPLLADKDTHLYPPLMHLLNMFTSQWNDPDQKLGDRAINATWSAVDVLCEYGARFVCHLNFGGIYIRHGVFDPLFLLLKPVYRDGEMAIARQTFRIFRKLALTLIQWGAEPQLCEFVEKKAGCVLGHSRVKYELVYHWLNTSFLCAYYGAHDLSRDEEYQAALDMLLNCADHVTYYATVNEVLTHAKQHVTSEDTVLTATMETLTSYLQTLATTPRRLKDRCRYVIYCKHKRRYKEKVDKSPLPKGMKKYLLNFRYQ